jgi:TonB family protein
MAEWMDALKRLQKLKSAGVLSEDEFASEKRKVLTRLQSGDAENPKVDSPYSRKTTDTASNSVKSQSPSLQKLTLGFIAVLGGVGLLIKLANVVILTNPTLVQSVMQHFGQAKATDTGLKIELEDQLPEPSNDQTGEKIDVGNDNASEASSETSDDLGPNSRRASSGVIIESRDFPDNNGAAFQDEKLTIDATSIADLAANPKTKVILDKELPGLTAHPAFDQFKGMTLKALQPMSGGNLTDEQLAAVQAGLDAFAKKDTTSRRRVAFQIQEPQWTRRPTGDDYARFYPEGAQRLEKEGSATIECVVTTKGALVNCQVLSEDPAGLGFGEATIKVASLWKMKPHLVDGNPVEANWQTRIRWVIPR